MRRAIFFVSALAVIALATGLFLRSSGASSPPAAQADGAEAKAILRNAAGDRVGKVRFEDDEGGVHVRVEVDAPLATLSAGFHGFHVHAIGTCTPPTFGSAGRHFDPADTGSDPFGVPHPNEPGDMPVLLVNDDGSGRGIAEARFVTDRFTVQQVVGKAVIVHLLADNYGNIPLGAGATQYTANSTGTALTTATGFTAATGNAGDRQACGVIQAAEPDEDND